MGGSEDIPSSSYQSGFRIYKLIKEGPLAKGGAKEFIDFIIPPPQVLDKPNSFNDWILSISDKTITLKLYSLLYRNFRYIEIKTNPSGSKDGILGASVKYENFENADKNLLHIISVSENSFAKNKLGLIPEDDYIIAAKPVNTPIIPLNKAEFNPIEILNIIINSNIGKEISFFIYNIKNGPRIVETKIEKGENDEKFILGCDVAYGALHGFPFAFNENESNINMNISKENENKEDKKEEIKCDKENNNNNIEEIKIVEEKELQKNVEEKNKELIEEDII